MAKCAICSKGVTFGNNVSHSNRKTSRTWKPNIRKVKADIGGSNKTICVCSRPVRLYRPEPNKTIDPVGAVSAHRRGQFSFLQLWHISRRIYRLL